MDPQDRESLTVEVDTKSDDNVSHCLSIRDRFETNAIDGCFIITLIIIVSLATAVGIVICIGMIDTWANYTDLDFNTGCLINTNNCDKVNCSTTNMTSVSDCKIEEYCSLVGIGWCLLQGLWHILFVIVCYFIIPGIVVAPFFLFDVLTKPWSQVSICISFDIYCKYIFITCCVLILPVSLFLAVFGGAVAVLLYGMEKPISWLLTSMIGTGTLYLIMVVMYIIIYFISFFARCINSQTIRASAVTDTDVELSSKSETVDLSDNANQRQDRSPKSSESSESSELSDSS